jgi:hypothetical protein
MIRHLLVGTMQMGTPTDVASSGVGRAAVRHIKLATSAVGAKSVRAAQNLTEQQRRVA